MIKQDATTGAGAFVPTSDELMAIARYWIDLQLEVQMDFFFGGTTDGSSLWILSHGNKRLKEIAKIIGRDEVELIEREISDEFKNRIGEDKWRIFKTGTKEEWRAVQIEAERQWEDQNAAVENDASLWEARMSEFQSRMPKRKPKANWETVFQLDMNDDPLPEAEVACHCCGRQLRWLNVLEHPDWPQEMFVGRKCAKRLTRRA